MIYFGGRCCYCGRTLRRNPPPEHQASGEHITPINSYETTGTFGATRFGNMALACVKCNNARGNSDLVDFIMTSKTIPQERRVMCLARIKSFRRLALYEEFGYSDSAILSKEIEQLNNYARSIDAIENPSKETDFQMREKIRALIEKMNTELIF